MVIVKIKIDHPYFKHRTYWYAQQCDNGWYSLVNDQRRRTHVPGHIVEELDESLIDPFTRIVGGI